MNSILAILLATLPFFGATGAQLLSHWLTIARENRNIKFKFSQQMQFYISDIVYMNMHLMVLYNSLSKQEDGYIFNNDPISFKFRINLPERDYQTLIQPGVLNRIKIWALQANDILDGLPRNKTEPHFTDVGFETIKYLIVNGMHLAIVLEKTKFGGIIENFTDVTRSEYIAHFKTYRFAGKVDTFTENDLNAILSAVLKDRGAP